jgi:quinol monooxygenase YgiN
MAFVLAVTWTAKAGNEDRVREILQILGEASRQEPGVITYTTHVDPENPREFFIYEKYHVKQAIPLLESRVRRQFTDF